MKELMDFLRQNGTKLIGYATAAVAFLSLADPALVVSLFGERGRSWILLIAGVATALRGHTNTAAIKDDIRVEEVAKQEIKVDKAVEKMQASPPIPPTQKEAP